MYSVGFKSQEGTIEFDRGFAPDPHTLELGEGQLLVPKKPTPKPPDFRLSHPQLNVNNADTNTTCHNKHLISNIKLTLLTITEAIKMTNFTHYVTFLTSQFQMLAILKL